MTTTSHSSGGLKLSLDEMASGASWNSPSTRSVSGSSNHAGATGGATTGAAASLLLTSHTSRTPSVPTWTRGVIVAREETAGALNYSSSSTPPQLAAAGNKKAIEPNAIVVVARSHSKAISSPPSSSRSSSSSNTDYGVWEKLARNCPSASAVQVQKTYSQDSIIVQAHSQHSSSQRSSPPPPPLRRSSKDSGASSTTTRTNRHSFSYDDHQHRKDRVEIEIGDIEQQEDEDEQDLSDEKDDLVSSVYSRTSTNTVIHRRSKNFGNSVVLDARTDVNDPRFEIDVMNELPSYELVSSAYVKSNAYAQLNKPSSSAPPGASSSSMMASSSSANVVTTHQPYSIVTTHPNRSYEKINQHSDKQASPNSTPTIGGGANGGGSGGSGQRQSAAHLVRESSLEPIGEEERLVQITQAVMNSQPSRSKRAEVLRFFSAARAFQIRVMGGDIQITDADGCPLFDAYQELDCRQRWWNIEAYGDRVLLMREELAFGDGSSSWGSRVTITDWNGEIFGYLITGDPMRLESAERTAVARLFSQPALVNNAACSNLTSVPKACWICQTIGDSNGDGRGEQIVARLETYQRLVFLGDGHTTNGSSSVGGGSSNLQTNNFHMKLFILAAVIRLVGALTVTPVSDCLALTKFFCNCCSYK